MIDEMKKLTKKTYISPSVKAYTIKLQPMLAGSGDATQVRDDACTDLGSADSRDNSGDYWEDDDDE